MLARKQCDGDSGEDNSGTADEQAAGSNWVGTLSRKRRAAPSFLDPHGGQAGRSPTLGVLSRKDMASSSGGG